MNKRIQELLEQSGPQPYYDAQEGQIEKFAELIIGECLEICRRGKYDGREDMSLIQFNNGIRFCMNVIDEHFGD